MPDATLYQQLDAAIQGILPGGVPLGTGLQELGAQTAPGAGLSSALAGGMVPAAPAAPRGRTMTAVASVSPSGAITPRSITPGGVALYSRDLSSYNRVKSLAKKLGVSPRRKIGKKRR